MNILSVNLGSFFTSQNLVANYCNDRKIDIACFQETFEHKVKPNLRGWRCFSKPRKANATETNPRVGVAILGRFSTKLTYSKINETCPDIEIICCDTYVQNQKILLICVYINDKQSMNKLCLWLHQIDYSKYPKIFLFGDFNAHHIFWDPKLYAKNQGEGDTEGKILLTCISRNGFKILNDKKPTCRQGNTVIDLAMCKGIYDCQVACYTDTFSILSTIHNPIITKIGQPQKHMEVKYNTKLSEEALVTWKTSLKNDLTDWQNKFSHLDNSSEKREEMCQNFLETIESSVKQHFKQKSVCIYSKPWMNKSIKKAITTFRRKKRIYVKYNNPSTEEDFIEAKNDLHNLIETAIQNHWKDFQNETSQLPQQKFWKQITNLVNQRSFNAVQPIFDPKTNDLVWDDNSILAKLTDVHIRRTHASNNYSFDDNFKETVDKKVDEILKQIETDQPQHTDLQNLNAKLTLNEIFEAIDNLNGSGASGPATNDGDPGLPPIILKLGKEVIGPPLHFLLQTLWHHGEFPSCLKKDKKIFIPKPEKDDYSKEKSYRMLTLSPCIAKVYDSIFAKRFYNWLESINFDEDQYAYRKFFSCQTAMFKLIQTIQQQMNDNKATIAIFIDLEGAFDAIWHQGLIFQLHSDGISGNILKLVKNILCNRRAICKVNDISKEFECSDTGACQGSNSAGLFFIYYIRKMMNDILSAKIKYSDDGTIYKSSEIENIPDLAKSMCEDFSTIMKWCKKWRMPVNLDKTKWMLFCKDSNHQNIKISIDAIDSNGDNKVIELEQTKSQKTLGIILDDELNFKDHLHRVEKIATSNLSKIRDLYEKHFGMPTHLAINLYSSYIRSIIESSYMCWCTIPENSLDKIESIQGSVLQLIMRMKGKVSYNALDVEAGVLPIKIRLKQILAQFGLKILRKSDNNSIKSLLTKNLSRETVSKSVTLADKIRMAMLSYTKNKFNFYDIESETRPDRVVQSVIETDLFLWKGLGNSSSRTERQKQLMKATVDSFLTKIDINDIIIFTDGSVINPDKHGVGKCGAGVIIYNKGIHQPPIILEKSTERSGTPYYGEIIAIKHALETCLELETNNVKKIYILTDCQSAITAITNNKASDSHQDVINKINQKAKNLLSKNIVVQMSWVGGHSEIHGNDLADHAAKKGAIENSNPLLSQITLKHAKSMILDAAIEHWQRRWNISETGHHFKNIQRNVSLGNSSKCLTNRKAQIILHQIKIGRSQLHAQDPISRTTIQDKLCTWCRVPEDTEHYMLECAKFSKHRYDMFMNIELALSKQNVNVRDLRKNLTFLAENKTLSKATREEILFSIALFLKNTKRLM